MAKKLDPAETKRAVDEVAGWLQSNVGKPSRSQLAAAVRATARTLAEELPGHAVELRVPPFVAVQCVEGPRHTRGTPPNVVEMDPETWLKLATGVSTFEAELSAGRVDASGSRAAEVARGLPVVRL
ncbi:sterol carrier family protein [Corynebacterium sp. TA-R-1]|uniref:Sterol carrier family protein n=1 Tax=Corynebacterium stercoris TaxID=2943490 RepID=A0ABT1G323_9CORY|nr:sterol carrier family protein [Corynebacterium stercoris]MCP1388418.1 sterol carrier family protein [Corynebacterium stercoris]